MRSLNKTRWIRHLRRIWRRSAIVPSRKARDRGREESEGTRRRPRLGDGQQGKRPPKQLQPCLQISRSVVEAIRLTIGVRPAESGGLLGGDRQDGVVRYYHFDTTSQRTAATYSPDCRTLNAILRDEWNPAGVNLLGFVHSHPESVLLPSPGDVIYAEQILKANPKLDCLALPIVTTAPDAGRFELHAYVAIRDGNDVRVEPRHLVVVEDGDSHSVVGKREPSPEARPEFRPSGEGSAAAPRSPDVEFDHAETFRRVRSAYDLDWLRTCRILYVGVGGAASFAEDNSRAGVEEHIFVDPDVVSEANIATQQVYRKDLGRPKVDCISGRLLDINPNVKTIALQRRFEEISDSELGCLVREPLWRHRPQRTLICALTDRFEPQARVNRVALHFGLPSLSAQVYREGRGAEITFTYPGVTPACHRCVLSSRYEAYLERGFRNDVTSDGTPIYATTRLNALKGMITMAILHHGISHPRWGRLLERIGNRNLVQIRMDPDIGTTLGLGVFERVFGGGDGDRILLDEAVWLPQKPDCLANGYPTCPDCGGTGDLRNAIGSFADTRVMRR